MAQGPLLMQKHNTKIGNLLTKGSLPLQANHTCTPTAPVKALSNLPQRLHRKLFEYLEQRLVVVRTQRLDPGTLVRNATKYL